MAQLDPQKRYNVRKEVSSFAKRKPLAAAVAVAATSAVWASAAVAEEVVLDEVVVQEQALEGDANPYAEEGAPYKAKKSSDSRRTRDIADTPQTMTVLTKEALDDAGKTELKDILTAQPGITLGTGEGGNSFGDRYIIRGYEARGDVFTDGLREPGLIARDTFAVEQIEITKGPSSTFAGRGSTGGAVNSMTKKANQDEEFTKISGGLGTHNYYRATIDSNHWVGDDTAVRINAVRAANNKPSRGDAGEDRTGAALAVSHRVNDDLNVDVDLYVYRADDKMDPGHTRDFSASEVAILEVPYDRWGNAERDFARSEANILTATADYQVNDNVVLENKTRFGTTANDYVINLQHRDGDVKSGWQENRFVGNQTNVIIENNLGGLRNTWVVGAEFTHEQTDTGSIDTDTTSATYGNRASQGGDIKITTAALYAMDTVTLSDDLEVFAGLRADHFKYDIWAESRGTVTDANYSDTAFNGHIGAVYSPWEDGNIYASASSSTNFSGEIPDAGSSCGYGGYCGAVEPETSVNLEIGTKWNLNDDKLLATAALFQTTKSNVAESTAGSDYDAATAATVGENWVRGLEFGLSGNLSDNLSMQAGLAVMDSEITKSFWDGTVAQTVTRGGTTTTSYPNNVGADKANFAPISANIQLSYQATPKLTVGGVLTGSAGMKGGQPDGGGSETVKTPGYGLLDLNARYEFSKNLSLTANIENVTDETYYTALYRAGSIVYLGDGRSAKLSLNYTF